ncbi:MAG: glutamate racemase [Tidjanibacter sp.]|nr:glutamate racemase [Tidjanibacter sp.]
MKRSAPIGIFDSGMGGLSVWLRVRQLMPNESIVYLADGKNCPYGDRTPHEIASLTKSAVEELLSRGVKIVVVACNTATAMAIDMLRESFDVEFVGMEPAVKPAALSSQSGVIGIVATHAALSGELFRATSAKYADRVKILSAVGEGFVEIVEQGEEHSPEASKVVADAIEPMLSSGADRIVLGCTHYPFLMGAIESVVGERKVEIIDPAPAVARRVEWLLERDGLRAEPDHKADYEFLSFADEEYRQRVEQRAKHLVGE